MKLQVVPQKQGCWAKWVFITNALIFPRLYKALYPSIWNRNKAIIPIHVMLCRIPCRHNFEPPKQMRNREVKRRVCQTVIVSFLNIDMENRRTYLMPIHDLEPLENDVI